MAWLKYAKISQQEARTPQIFAGMALSVLSLALLFSGHPTQLRVPIVQCWLWLLSAMKCMFMLVASVHMGVLTHFKVWTPWIEGGIEDRGWAKMWLPVVFVSSCWFCWLIQLCLLDYILSFRVHLQNRPGFMFLYKIVLAYKVYKSEGLVGLNKSSITWWGSKNLV